MENNKEPEVKRKRGRPPLNKSLNGTPTKYRLKAPQSTNTPKEDITPIEQRSPIVDTKESGIETTIKPTEEMKQAFSDYNDKFLQPTNESSKDICQHPMADLIPVEAIEFTKGKNTLKILLSKKHNRMYRVQIFLNDSVEIRPATYTGFSPASTFWGFLKEMTK